MAKKKQSKKHQFKYAAPAGATVAAPSPNLTTTTPRAKAATALPVVQNLDYVARDVSRVGLFAAGLIILQLVLWWAFEHTGLGSAVYSLIKT